MKSIITALTLLALPLTLAFPSPAPQATPVVDVACPRKPAYFLLAGDSTTATQRASNITNGGGWGDGFLNYTLKCNSKGQNFGHNGATTASFRAGGDWANVLAQVNQRKQNHNVFVTIQFGHNDQKSTSGVSLAQYSANLVTFANDVYAAGGTPILVTPLTRRGYTNTTGNINLVTENLTTQRILTIQAAITTDSRYIDLNDASTVYCDEIGQTAAWRYNLADYSNDVTLAGTDQTHLNVAGSVVFGRMVSGLMADKYSDIAAVTLPNVPLSVKIANGIPA